MWERGEVGMTKETPSLSDKEWTNGSYTGYLKNDVKEAVKEFLEVFHMGVLYEGGSIWKIAKKYFGDKLI